MNMKKLGKIPSFDFLYGSDGGDRTPDLSGMNRTL